MRHGPPRPPALGSESLLHGSPVIRGARRLVRAALCLGLASTAACSDTPAPPTTNALPGEPLPGLTSQEQARFQAGRALFGRAFTEAEGLGPLFNQRQCSSCHDLPTSGGRGAEPVRKATRYSAEAGCDLLVDDGGDLFQSSFTEAARRAGLGPERLPPHATGITVLAPPPLYGLGLAETIPVERLEAHADPNDADGDGISGRLGTDALGGVGRFGAKANHASLRSFIEEATLGELGLTSPGRPTESPSGQGPLPAEADPAPDPEVDAAFIDALVDYVRFLAPPLPEERGMDGEAAGRGGRLFESIGCADCHVPRWTSGPDPSPGLAEQAYIAYSDFLLHDMGPDLADICGTGASPSEWRTTPLVGLSYRRTFLHHGRAQTLEQAIGLHGGEAARARAGFVELSESERADVLAFLASL